jgi:hypothetical protein
MRSPQRSRGLALRLPQHPDEHRPERSVLLAVNQQLPQDPGLPGGPKTSPIRLSPSPVERCTRRQPDRVHPCLCPMDSRRDLFRLKPTRASSASGAGKPFSSAIWWARCFVTPRSSAMSTNRIPSEVVAVSPHPTPGSGSRMLRAPEPNRRPA